MFQLTKSESEDLRSKFATSNSRSQNVILKDDRGKLESQNATLKQGHNIKYQPYAFTENGVAMLSSVLRSKTAIEVNIRIIRAFTAMRSFLMSNAHIFQRLETVEHNYLLVNRHLFYRTICLKILQYFQFHIILLFETDTGLFYFNS